MFERLRCRAPSLGFAPSGSRHAVPYVGHLRAPVAGLSPATAMAAAWPSECLVYCSFIFLCGVHHIALLSPPKNVIYPYVQQSGNKISRKSVLCGSQNTVLQGKVQACSSPILVLRGLPTFYFLLRANGGARAHQKKKGACSSPLALACLSCEPGLRLLGSSLAGQCPSHGLLPPFCWHIRSLDCGHERTNPLTLVEISSPVLMLFFDNRL